MHVKKSVAPQQNKTKWEAFHVSGASVYNGVYAMTENIIVMLVAAEVMAPASVCGEDGSPSVSARRCCHRRLKLRHQTGGRCEKDMKKRKKRRTP